MRYSDLQSLTIQADVHYSSGKASNVKTENSPNSDTFKKPSHCDFDLVPHRLAVQHMISPLASLASLASPDGLGTFEHFTLCLDAEH